MTRRISSALLVALATAGMTAGCGSSDRPAELSLDDVKPCNLISRQTLDTLQVTTDPLPDPLVPGSGEEGSSCFYQPRYGGTVIVSVVTNQGIDHWTDSSGDTKGIDRPRIQGYRTIRLTGPSYESGSHAMCTLYVDVADGQSLRAEAGPNGDGDPPSCEISRQFAEAAVASLAKQG